MDNNALNIFRKIKEILQHEMHYINVDMDLESTFIEDLGMDSLDLVELTIKIETYFNISISDDQANEVKCIIDLVLLIEENRVQ
tara:strand:+ start:1715 stop:1966 length:252 start_codon:yes stop_codon:yes gene_type:complete